MLVRVSASVYSADARFVISGSDDGNVRIWKAKASEKLGIITARERAAMEYRESLKERWKVDAQIDRVMRYVRFAFQQYENAYFLQDTSLAEICPTSKQIETDDVRSTQSQRREETEAYQGWRKQAEGREEKSGYRGAHLTSGLAEYNLKSTAIICLRRIPLDKLY